MMKEGILEQHEGRKNMVSKIWINMIGFLSLKSFLSYT